MTRALVLNYTETSTNWGLNACSRYLAREISNHVDEIEAVDYDTIHGEYVIDHIKFAGKRFYLPQRKSPFRRLVPKSLRIPLVADDFEYIKDEWLKGNGGVRSRYILEAIKRSDYIIFNAEGSCYRMNFGARSGLFILWIAQTVYKKRCIFVNGSVTLTEVDDVLTGIVGKCHQAGIKFLVREKCSYDIMRSRGFSAVLCPDSAFAMAEDKFLAEVEYSYRPPKEKYFCVSKSMLPMSKYSRDAKAPDPLGNIVSKLAIVSGATPIIIAADSEDIYIKRIVDYIPSAIVFPSNAPFYELARIISGAEFILSGRYHHLIFALCGNTPIIPMNTTSVKVKGLMRDTPYLDTILDPTYLNRPDLDIKGCLTKSLQVSAAFQSAIDAKRRCRVFRDEIENIFTL